MSVQLSQQLEKKLLTILLGGCCWVFLCSFTMADPDLWGHTIYGIRAIELEVLTERTDPFSYSANGAPWFNHEWATEYEMGWLWGRFGNAGLLAWKVLILAMLMAWLTRSMIRSDSSVGARLLLITFTTMCLGNFVVFIRPQLVTFLLFPIFLSILNQCWEKWSAAAWGLPVLMTVWVNHHGGFLAGVALIGFYTVLLWARYFITRSKRELAVRMTGVLVAALIATLINPYGFQLHFMLWTHLGTEQHVREWQAVWDVGFSWVYLAPFLVLIFAFAFNRKWRWVDLLVMLLVAFQALMHLRHVALLCLAEMIFLPSILTASIRRVFPQICQRWDAPESMRLRFCGVGGSILFLFFLQIQGAIPLWKSGLRPWEIVVETSSNVPGMPTRAIRFLNDHELHGNILTDYGWGQFVIWQSFPKSLVGFDGRYRTVYSPKLEADFLEFQRSGDSRPLKTPFLDEYPTQIVLLPVQAGAVSYMEHRSDWKTLYRDGQAQIFVKHDFLPDERFSQIQIEISEEQRLSWEIFPAVGKTGTKIAR